MTKTINCLVIHAAGYKMTACKLRKGDLDKLNMIVKSVLRRERFRRTQQGLSQNLKQVPQNCMKVFDVHDVVYRKLTLQVKIF